MSIRVTLCFLVIAWLSVISWRGKWFFAACGSVVMMAFLERKDMPRAILGIPGLNLWNVLFVNMVGGWLSTRRQQGLTWDFPPRIKKAFVFYLVIILWAFSRLFLDPTRFYPGDRISIIMDYLINPLKFLVPGIILFDGCRSPKRIFWALGAIVLTYFLMSSQVIRYMGFSQFSGRSLSERAARVIQRDVGYNRVDMSMMLAGASWAVIAFSTLFRSKVAKLLLWMAAGSILVGQALTGGRTGYVTWGLIGLTLCVLRWRKLLPLVPIAVAVVFVCLPGVRERMMFGFAQENRGVVDDTDTNEMTSGRNVAWPYVIDEIQKAPFIGYGRLGMMRTGLSALLLDEAGEVFGHPHNAYLELLLDTGIVGFLCVMPLFWILLRRCVNVFTVKGDQYSEAAGGVALSLLLALMIAGLGAQTFFPREGVVGMWAALGVAIRVWADRQQVDHSTSEFDNDGSEILPPDDHPDWEDRYAPQRRFAFPS